MAEEFERIAEAMERVADAFEIRPSPRSTKFVSFDHDELVELLQLLPEPKSGLHAIDYSEDLRKEILRELSDRRAASEVSPEEDWGSTGEPISIVENLRLNLANATPADAANEHVVIPVAEWERALDALREAILRT